MTLGQAISAYLADPRFAKLRPASQTRMRRVLKKLAPLYGEEIGAIRRPVIADMARGMTNGSKAEFLSAASALFARAVDEEWISANPVKGIAQPRLGSHRGWKDSEWAAFIRGATPPIRLTAMLARYTGQRRSDIVKMRLDHIEEIDGQRVIRVEQQKTGLKLAIPISPALDLAIPAYTKSGFLLETEQGEPFDVGTLTHRFGRERMRLGLPKGLVIHGLRRTLAEKAVEQGATIPEAMSLGGWTSIKTFQGYIKGADQLRLATRAMRAMDPSPA